MKLWLPVIVAVVATSAAAVLAAMHFTEGRGGPIGGVTLPGCPDRVFGHIRSLVPAGKQYVLRLDPAFWLSGETANAAAAEDGAVAPGEPAPNDYYIVDESRRTLEYVVPRWAKVTVLTNDPAGIKSTSVDVAELEEIVRTGESSQRRLFGSLESGVRIRYWKDTVCKLDQQYRP